MIEENLWVIDVVANNITIDTSKDRICPEITDSDVSMGLLIEKWFIH